MMKFVLLLVVVVVAAWMFTSRSRVKPPKAERPRQRQAKQPDSMVPCAQCGLHLPKPDTLQDAAGRDYCSEAHRWAGPR
jgi:uncharacterized protein